MNPGTPPQHFYKPELDGLRFLAFFLVFLHHGPALDGLLKPENPFSRLLQAIHSCGWIGVDLFFSLSAYLITKLLWLEWKADGTIIIRNFLIRRVLRIWPLCILICFLVLFLFPRLEWIPAFYDSHHQNQISLFLIPLLLFLSNWLIAVRNPLWDPSLNPLWTISLEEQFYLAWPFLLKFFRFDKKYLLILSGMILAFTLAAREIAMTENMRIPFIYVSTVTRLDPFILGSLLALFESRLVEMKKRIPADIFTIIGILGLASFLKWSASKTNVAGYLPLDFSFCILIFSAGQPGRLKSFVSWPVFIQGGRISYGLYIFQFLGLAFAERFLKAINTSVSKPSSFWYPMTETLAGFGITVLLAFVSYHAYEKWFLKLKPKFTQILSRPV